MLSEVKKPNSVALELTEIGLSLFTCEGDVPTECIAHVDLDDPDFAQKSGGFRNAAEAHVGKGFQTDIWLPDEQVMVRSIKLEGSHKDQRAAAYSALSASTPFHGDALCFDLGDANGAGYTPVAAIPRDKMDEAMDFAKKMRMNPKSITTSNVVFGFSDRPDFKPYEPEVKTKSGTARAMALAAVLVAPVLLFTGERMSEPTGNIDAGLAFVAAFENVPTVDASNATLVTHRKDETPSSGAPDLAGEYAPLRPFSYEVTDFSATVGATDVHWIAPDGPMAVTAAAPYGNELLISRPEFLVQDVPGLSAEIEFRSDRAETPFIVHSPRPLSALEEDTKPTIFSDVSDYVKNILDGPIRIRDLVAVEEYVISDTNFEEGAVRVANIEGPVRRPSERLAPRLIQPAFAKPPVARPTGPVAQDAFLDAAEDAEAEQTINIDIPKPVFGWYVERGLMPNIGSFDTVPDLPAAPNALVFVPSQADKAVLKLVWRDKKRAAEERAANNPRSALARLQPPKTRDLFKASPDGGVVQYTTTAALKTWTSPKDHNGKTGLSPPRSSANPVATLPPGPLAAFAVAEILPTRLFARAPLNPSAEIAPEDTAEVSQDDIEPTAPVELIARPKARKTAELPVETVALTPDAGGISVPEDVAPETGVTAQEPEPIDAFKLRRPPARKARIVPPVAAVESPEVPTGPISKVAIARLLTPIERPGHLRKTAAKILAQRASLAAQVAKKQEPVQTTNSNRLRIPSNARVATTATIKDGLNLGDISLIGIFGKSNSRRALVRLPQGRYVQITQGDNVSGWTVSAVGKDAVRIMRRGKNMVLRLPN